MSLTLRKTPPANVDWTRIQSGFEFMKQHGQSISFTNGAAALVSTYACKDIEPVLIRTGEVVDDYDTRMDKTGEWINQMLTSVTSKTIFLQKNYERAFDLGEFHLRVASHITPKDLGWNPRERTVLNQQAVAFVLYALAWQPIETMEATHEVDPDKDAQGIDNYLYLWRTFGYAMGLEQPLLPTDAHAAVAMVSKLRTLQYPAPGQATPKEMPILLRNEMTYLYKVVLNGKPADDASKHQVRQMLAQSIATSLGLSQALGLGDDPAAGLEALARG